LAPGEPASHFREVHISGRHGGQCRRAGRRSA
jgi:hypothetical protein